MNHAETALVVHVPESRDIGFELGWDYAIYGMTPGPDAPKAMLDGYSAGIAAGVRHHRLGSPDRFVRKWLTLRLNAYRRNRIVQPDVTIEHLRMIDVSHCPITRKRLTHGTLEGTDWSVDRVNNDGAYARLNLVIMSRDANSAKGNLTQREIAETWLSMGPDDVVSGLTAPEWLRLLTLVSFSSESPVIASLKDIENETILPMAVTSPFFTAYRSWHLRVQHCLHSDAINTLVEGTTKVSKMTPARLTEIYSHHAKSIPTTKLRAVYLDTLRFLIKVAHRRLAAAPNKDSLAVTFAVEDAWTEKVVMDQFRKLLRAALKNGTLTTIGKSSTIVPISGDAYRNDLSLDSKGFI